MLKKYIELDKDTLGAVGKASVMGMHMVSGVLVGGALGWFFDWLLGTEPWLLIIFFLLGIVAGFRNVWVDMKSLIKDQEATDKAIPASKKPSTYSEDEPDEDADKNDDDDDWGASS